MKNRKTLYCDIEFISALDEKDKLDFVELCCESCVVVNIPLLDFEKKAMSDITIKMLGKKRSDGLCTIKYKESYTSFFNSLEKDTCEVFYYCPIILIKQSQKQRREENLCRRYNTMYGIACYDQSNFNEIKRLNEDGGFAISKGDNDSWHERFQNVQDKGNSMVIIDPYILKDTKTFKKNIYEILENLLPIDMHRAYNLTIITRYDNGDLNTRYEKLSSYLNNIRSETDFNLSFNILLDTKNLFHDRIILTNYYTITCGAGFDLFNEDGVAKHTTTVSFIYPFIQKYNKWAVDNYTNQLSLSKELADSVVNNNNIVQYCGENKMNRLFMLSNCD